MELTTKWIGSEGGSERSNGPMRILLNVCHGGFGIQNVVLGELGLGPTREEVPEYCRQERSREGIPRPLVEKYRRERRGRKRTNTALIERVLAGESVGDLSAHLGIVEIDDALSDYWEIHEYDGLEEVKIDTARWMSDELDRLGDALPTHETVTRWKALLTHTPTLIFKQPKRDAQRPDEWKWYEVCK